MSSNLPPGVTSSMIPSNQDDPYEELFDHITGVLDEHDVTPNEFKPFVEPLVKTFVEARKLYDLRKADEAADWFDRQADDPKR